MNPQQPQKRGLFSFGPGNKMPRLFLLIGGGAIILILLIMLLSLVFGGGGETGQKLLEIAQTQTELVRLADDAQSKARSSTTLNLANTISLSVASSKNQLTPLIKKYGGKADTKLLTAKHNAATDQQLAAATESNQYDETFTAIITKELKDYQTELKTTYTSVTKPADKQVLKTAYNGATLLLRDDQSN
jgi:hypothetical protein